MANRNGIKYGLTCLFPIERNGASTAGLRNTLNAMEDHPQGSPLAAVNIIHLARFAIVDHFACQGAPAKQDALRSNYLLFMCDFDGDAVETLTAALADHACDVVRSIWRHCVAFPELAPRPTLEQRDALAHYFKRCQIRTTLFVADRHEDSVEDILRALDLQRRFVAFIAANQCKDAATLKAEFARFWRAYQNAPPPDPGSI